MTFVDVDSPWADDTGFEDTFTALPNEKSHSQNEWDRMSSTFSTVGYREGLAAGKESDAIQEGFDEAFASIGVPLGRELGLLRGLVSALLAFLSSQASRDAGADDIPSKATGLATGSAKNPDSYLARARALSVSLSELSFPDIVPRDLDAEEHARHHLAEMQPSQRDAAQAHAEKHLNTTDALQKEIVSERRIKEGIEDILNGLMGGRTGGYGYGGEEREEARKIKMQVMKDTRRELEVLLKEVGLDIDIGLSTTNVAPPERS